MSDVLDRVTRGPLEPVYVLVSDQPFLLDRTVTAIADAAVPEAARGFNYDTIDGKGMAAGRVLHAAMTLPMMARMRMVLVRDIAAAPAAELAKLTGYLDDPNPSTVLVATASKVDKRIKFFAQARKKKALHELLLPRNLSSWVEAEARARGVSLAPRAAARLCDVVGKDLARLVLSLDQLGLYAGDRAVKVADIDDLIADTRERSIFELTQAIGQADRASALSAVIALCEQRQSAIGVVVMLARHMRQIGVCHGAMSERLGNDEIARRVGVPPFVVSKLIAQARRYPPEAIPLALARLSLADRELKGQTQVMKTLGRTLGERVILDRVVGEIITLAR